LTCGTGFSAIVQIKQGGIDLHDKKKSPLPQVFYPIIPLTLGEYLITKYLL
jgi:hypothetical protein